LASSSFSASCSTRICSQSDFPPAEKPHLLRHSGR
jgi:hypothetical protein